MMRRTLCSLVCLLILWSCGAGSDDSTGTSTTDTITSLVAVTFSSNTKITVVKKGADAKSLTWGEVCSLDMSSIEGDISYVLASSDSLEFSIPSTSTSPGSSTRYSYKRPLDTPKTKSGIPDRVFSVWGNAPRVVDNVTVTFELEVEPELLTFRLICDG